MVSWEIAGQTQMIIVNDNFMKKMNDTDRTVNGVVILTKLLAKFLLRLWSHLLFLLLFSGAWSVPSHIGAYSQNEVM